MRSARTLPTRDCGGTITAFGTIARRGNSVKHEQDMGDQPERLTLRGAIALVLFALFAAAFLAVLGRGPRVVVVPDNVLPFRTDSLRTNGP